MKFCKNADAICFTRGRVKFYEGDKIADPTQGQVFSYFGDDVSRFAQVFQAVGFVVPLPKIAREKFMQAAE
jgi:hypothetical protein